jgi:hypothetical protein
VLQRVVRINVFSYAAPRTALRFLALLPGFIQRASTAYT